MKKVLIIVPTLQCGGMEHVACKTATILRDLYDVTLIVFDSKNADFNPECKVIDAHLPVQPTLLKKLLNIIRRINFLTAYKKREKIEVSYSFGPTANLINVFSKSGDQVIISLRGNESSTKKTIINQIVYKYADKIIAVSEEIKNGINKKMGIGLQKVYVLNNPFDLSMINEMANCAPTIPMTDRTIVSVGRLDSIKGFDSLIFAFNELTKKYKDVELMIIGEGEERNILENIIDTLKLGEKVHLAGYQKNPYCYVKKGLFFVMSSFSEGFPNALVEAMCCGSAVISTNCKSGPLEILSGTGQNREMEMAEYGILISLQKGDYKNRNSQMISEMVQAMTILLEKETIRTHYKVKALERAKEFSYEKYKEKIIEIFENKKGNF